MFYLNYSQLDPEVGDISICHSNFTRSNISVDLIKPRDVVIEIRLRCVKDSSLNVKIADGRKVKLYLNVNSITNSRIRTDV